MLLLFAAIALGLAACEKDNNPIAPGDSAEQDSAAVCGRNADCSALVAFYLETMRLKTIGMLPNLTTCRGAHRPDTAVR